MCYFTFIRDVTICYFTLIRDVTICYFMVRNSVICNMYVMGHRLEFIDLNLVRVISVLKRSQKVYLHQKEKLSQCGVITYFSRAISDHVILLHWPN